jgi:zinc transporter ZupT
MTKDEGRRPLLRLSVRRATALLAALTLAFAVPFGLLIYAVIADRPGLADAVAPWLMPLGLGLLLSLAVQGLLSGKDEA